MKKNNLLVAIGAVGFGILFYDQTAGLNFLLFSILFAAFSISLNYKNYGKIEYGMLLAHLLSAYNVFSVHTTVSLWAWSISLLLTVGKLAHANSTIMLSIYSGLATPIASFNEMYKRYFTSEKTKPKNTNWTYLIASLISFFILLIFFFLYKGANPLFNGFTNKIDFSWFNLPFILCCIAGFYVFFNVLNPYIDQFSMKWDIEKANKRIQTPTNEASSEFKKLIIFVSIALFVGLNIMLLFLNSLDIQSIFILEKLPENIFLSDFLHFAVTSIVISILLAIIIIGSIQQFSIENKLVKGFIYTWIVQSIIMVTNTFIRNYWYSMNQITYLRIGVFVFLSLCMFGLLYTAYCLYKNRNYWYLLHLNMQTWFIVLILSSFFSWDRIITKHNLSYQKVKEIDFEYILDLSDNNIDLLMEFATKKEFDSIKNEYYGLFRNYTFEEYLTKRKIRFIRRVKKQQWQSFNLADNHLKNKILINSKKK